MKKNINNCKTKKTNTLKILGELIWEIFKFTPSVIYCYISKKIGIDHHNLSYEERKRNNIEKLQNKPDFKIKLKERIRLLKNNPESWEDIEVEYQETIELVEIHLKNYPEHITFVDVRFQNNPKIAIPTYKKIPQILSHSNHIVRDNPIIMKPLIIQHSYQYKFLSDRLKNDRDFMLSVVKENPFVFPCLKEIWKKDEEFKNELRRYIESNIRIKNIQLLKHYLDCF